MEGVSGVDAEEVEGSFHFLAAGLEQVGFEVALVGVHVDADELGGGKLRTPCQTGLRPGSRSASRYRVMYASASCTGRVVQARGSRPLRATILPHLRKANRAM